MADNRDIMLDSKGHPLTQSLFLELGYAPTAVYTLKEHDYEYNGKLYPSIKRLYIQANDPTEYEFATLHFMGWKHWQRLCENRVIKPYVEEWRDELNIKIRAEGVRALMAAAKGGNYQASKWLADKGWISREAGRPSKEEIAGERVKIAKELNEYDGDIARLKVVKNG